MSPQRLPTQKTGYFPVLDALRFVLAFWVVVGHLGMPLLFGDLTTGTGYWLLLKRGWNTIVFGTPAVIVFFVISGFCIHLPFRGSQRIDVARYYLRRYTRILIPVAAALVVYRLFGRHLTFWGERSILWASPLWSLACEEIYYAMYPLLRWLRNTVSWKVLLPASFFISIPISARHQYAFDWHVFGPFGTAMMLLPVWLLGCLLAEQAELLPSAKSGMTIWIWRFLAWFGSWIAEMVHFKLHISYTITMVWFGILAYFWVRAELAHGKTSAPNRYLVAAGAWSYSLYLVHVQGAELIGLVRLPRLGPVPDWSLAIVSSLVFAYVFYLLVERPSHRLAQKIRVAGSWKPRQSESGFVSAGVAGEAPFAPVKASPPLKGIVGDEL